MTPNELYEALDKAGADYEVIEVFEGARVLLVQVSETETGDEE